jgi:hypothetical protein
MRPQIACKCSQKASPPAADLDHAMTLGRLLWIGVLCSTLVTVWLPQRGWPEGTGRIRGTIQRDGKGLAEQRIMLIRFGSNQDVQRFPGQTDAEGRFVFENLEIGPGFTYFVGIRSNDQLHRSEPVILQNEEPVEVLLEVGAQSAQEAKGSAAPVPLRIINHLMVIVGRDSHLEVREIVRIVNSGTAPYIESAGHGGAPGISLRLPLPQGHYNMSQVQGLQTDYVRVDASGLSYLAPLPPGEHQLIYTYSLPWHDGLTTLLLERTLDTTMLDVLVEEEHLNAASDLQFGRRVSIDPHVFSHLRGMNLEAHSRSWLQLTPRQTSASWLSMGAYGLIMGIVLLGLCMPLYDVWRGQAQADPAPAEVLPHTQSADMKRGGRYLLQSIARLDDEYEHGIVEAETYQQRRQAYKEQLCKLIEELQRNEVSQQAMRGRAV